MERFSQKNAVEKEKTYPEALVEILDIPSEQTQELSKMFKMYCAEKIEPMDTEDKKIKLIRRFLKEKKSEYKQQFKGSLLGQSGCFPASLRACLLADEYEVSTRLARSSRPLSALHVLLMRADGSPLELTNFEKHEPIEMTLPQIRAYARFAQPILAAADSLRHRHTPSEKPLAVQVGFLPPEQA